MLTTFTPTEHPHRRHNPLTGDWVLVSPHRTKRPWLGKVEKSAIDRRPAHDPTCYLCAGNERAGGKTNPNYTGTFVFDNDFAALLSDAPRVEEIENSFFHMEAETGICRVICFSPRHDLTLPEMSLTDIKGVIKVWCEQVHELGSRPDINYVQLFENKGDIMGCSNPHPHGQVWANHLIPHEPAKEDRAQRTYYNQHGTPMLTDYLAAELARDKRIVVENDDWVALVPFWAVWPFETMLLPRRHIQQMTDLRDNEQENLADILKRLLTRYDNLFESSFPYSMGWHGQPTDGGNHEHWQLHAHFYPPLLRSATVKKFMVGYEMLATPQRDITAEQAAERLSGLNEVHYKQLG